MASTNIDIAVPSGAKRYANTDCNETKDAVKAASGTLYAVVIDNSLNVAASYVKLWDVASGSVTIGTTAPDWIFKVAASGTSTIVWPSGQAFGTALTVGCVTTAGTAGTTGPTSDVVVQIVYA